MLFFYIYYDINLSGIYSRVKTVSGESFSQEQNNVGSNREILLQIDTKNNTYCSVKSAIFLICDGLYGGMEFHVVCHGLYIGDFK